MKITDMTDREQIANELKERLRWLEDNTVDEEYNIREAAAIKQLLRIMEPAEPDWDAAYFEPASAEQRFWDTYETRVDIEQEKEKLLTGRLDVEPDLSENNILIKTEEGEKKPAQPQKKNLFLYFATHRWAAAAWIAVVLTVVILASGTVGAYAQSRGGIFHFFQNDEEGIDAIIIPDDIDDDKDDTNMDKLYTNINDIPAEYVENFCFFEDLCNTYNVESIKVLDHHLFVLYESKYIDSESNKYIVCSQKHYINQITFIRQMNDEYILTGNEIVEGIEVTYYYNENKGDTVHFATFIINKDSFVICGDEEAETIAEAAKEIIERYVENYN